MTKVNSTHVSSEIATHLHMGGVIVHHPSGCTYACTASERGEDITADCRTASIWSYHHILLLSATQLHDDLSLMWSFTWNVALPHLLLGGRGAFNVFSTLTEVDPCQGSTGSQDWVHD